jgi:hypothetical protein
VGTERALSLAGVALSLLATVLKLVLSLVSSRQDAPRSEDQPSARDAT